MKGYGSHFLYVNLTSGKITKRRVKKAHTRKYLGGLGFATKLLMDNVNPRVNPLKSNNAICIVPGLLVDTAISTGSKTTFTFKSPATGTFGRAVVGATLGVQMRRNNLEGIVIKGKAKNPIMLVIEDGKFQLRSAKKYWGKDTFETEKMLKDDFGKAFATAVIGPGGENLSYMASVECEGRQAARGGVGAVFGSKKLKAIVIKGTGKKIIYHKEEKLKDLIKYWGKIIKDHPATKADMSYGSGEFYSWMNTSPGTFPAKNWQLSYVETFDKLKKGELSSIDPYSWVSKYMVKYHPCPNCSKPCGRLVQVKSGKYKSDPVDGVEYELIYSLAGVQNIDDAKVMIKANEICDKMGLDGISAGVTVAWAMEAYEKGLLSKKDTEGLDLRFGNADAALQVYEKMAKRKGKLGKLLADGTKVASKKLGKGSYKFAIHIKGLELPAYDVRGIKGMALALAVSVRGACHLTGGVYGIELGGNWWQFHNVDRLATTNKGFEVKTSEDLMTLYDALGMCKFSRHMYFLEGFPDMIYAITGFKVSYGELMAVGERIYNLQKLFNIKAGLKRKDDTLPYRVMHDPITKGASKGSYVKEEELQYMLNEYYQARGWSPEGIPTQLKLFTLDLNDYIEKGYGV